MKRNYTHVKALEKEMLEMKAAGKTNSEIAEHFGYKDKEVVKNWIKRYNRKKRSLEAGILPKSIGRPSKNLSITEQQKTNELKRLRMENELLRDFLYLSGRR